jgi:GT2 family glycosyltransferase
MSCRISVVIPTWNARGLVTRCLDSLRAQLFEGFEVIVVDDASTDDTAAVLARDYAAVRVVGRAANGGFAKAANAGIRAARADLVFLLNNDVTLEPDCLEKLWNAAAASDAALFCPVMLAEGEGPAVVYGAGDLLRRSGRPEAAGAGTFYADRAFPDRVFGVSGGAALIRREVFDTVGLFDPAFVAYFEDADFCCRARLAGFTARLLPHVFVWHTGSASLGGRHLWRARRCCANHAALVLKNYPAGALVRCAPEILRERIHQYGRVFSVGRAEVGTARAARAVAATAAESAARLPGVLRQRWRIQRGRRMDAGDFLTLLT